MHPHAALPWPWSDFFSSSADSLQKLMQNINNIDFPSLASKDFRDFWAIDFAFAVIVAILAFMASLLKFAKTKKWAGPINGLITVFGTFVVGFFTPPILYILTWLSKRLAYAITLIPQGMESHTDPWYVIYKTVIDGTQPLTVWGSQAFGDVLSGILTSMVSSVVAGLFLFAFIGFAAWPSRLVPFGFTVYRIGVAGVVTSIFLGPIVLFVLALGVVALKLSGTDVGNSDGYGTIVLIACALPLVLFWTIFRRSQKIQIEGPVATTNDGPGSWFRNAIPFGWANDRPYAGKIPQAGDTMEGAARHLNKFSTIASTAAKALAVSGVGTEFAPVAAGIAAATGAAGAAASSSSERAREANDSTIPSGNTAALDSENYTLNGATVTTADAYNNPPSSTPQIQDAPEQPIKPSRVEAVRNGASTVATGIAKGLDGTAKAARWTSGAQRKTQAYIDRQLGR